MSRSNARMLDANFNRAREGARVVEDYARFILDHSALSKECKAVRHELQTLARCMEQALGVPLSSFRDTPGDVGTRTGSRSEARRAKQADVMRANLKRLQESLRVLEEYSKWLGPAEHARFKRLRYRSYTLEQCMERAAAQQGLFARTCRVIALSARECKELHFERLGAVVAAHDIQGCMLRQHGEIRAALRTAVVLRALFPPGRGLLLVADDVTLALRARADGVVWEARKPSSTALAQLESAGIRSGGAGKKLALLKKHGCRPFCARTATVNSLKTKVQSAPVVWIVSVDELTGVKLNPVVRRRTCVGARGKGRAR